METGQNHIININQFYKNYSSDIFPIILEND